MQTQELFGLSGGKNKPLLVALYCNQGFILRIGAGLSLFTIGDSKGGLRVWNQYPPSIKGCLG